MNKFYCCGKYWESDRYYDTCDRCNKEVTPHDINMEMLITLASRVSALNPYVPEIGAGMLRSLVSDAKGALNITE